MSSVKYSFVFIFLVCIFFSSSAVNSRSDTIDILDFTIHLDITDLSGASINGYTTLKCSPKINGVSTINLDLLKLNIDSIKIGSNNLSYSYNDTLVSIQLGNTYNSSDTFDLTLYYYGKPQKDLSNWGGFYFQSGFAFNLGVGFDANPHNYGRVWFPCFDNFVERSTFTFEIITSNGKKPYCNGEFQSEVLLSGDTILTTWVMKESIPTYLASVAVGPYVDVNWNYQGIQSVIPVQLAVKAADSNKLKASFIHLDDAMDAFEIAYGPYLFNKVGYSVVPFSSGAMEHASNIAYPSNAVNGNTNSELLMAHELAHMWWGNLVTCDKAEEMWINEGWATYSTHLFLEHLNGRSSYDDEVLKNHLEVIQYAHYKEEKYWPVFNLPHRFTYGMHVYKKGATVAHNLRNYMGDAKFFAAIKKLMSDSKFTDVSSAFIRDEFSNTSGIDLTNFFDDWVFGAGYTHISIDSFKVSPSAGLYNVELFVRQKKRGSDHFFNGVPIKVFFHDDQYNVSVSEIVVSGEFSSFQIQIPIDPVMISLNENNNLAMAVTADQLFISKTGSYSFENGKMDINVTSISDSFLIRVEHNWAHADKIKKTTVKHRISDYRYWKVDGIFPNGLNATAILEYDGRLALSGGAGHLDDDLLANGSDSIILLYRKNASQDWWEYQYYKKISFPGIKFGRMELDSLVPGEYTFANGYSAIGIEESKFRNDDFKISPNPVSSQLKIKDLNRDTSVKELYVFSMSGRLIYKEIMKDKLLLDVSQYQSGNYLLYIIQNGNPVYSGKFVVTK